MYLRLGPKRRLASHESALPAIEEATRFRHLGGRVHPPYELRYIEAHREQIKDPNEGYPIPSNWQTTLLNGDVQELADFALTRFYDPAADGGLGETWLIAEGAIPEQDRSALLGTPIGHPDHEFDPGRQGSYFQTPEQVTESLRRLERCGHEIELESYIQLLQRCSDQGLGVYVTF